MDTSPVTDASDSGSPSGLRRARWWKAAFVPLILALGLALALIVVMSQLGGSAPNAVAGSPSPSPSPTPSVEPTPSPTASATLPSASPTLDPLALFGAGVEPVLTFEGIGPVLLGKSTGEVSDGIQDDYCGSSEGLPYNIRFHLEPWNGGNIVRINVHAPWDEWDSSELRGVRTIHGIEFGDDVDAVSDALGTPVVIEELVSKADYRASITLFQLTLRESIDGVDRVMTINFGEQEQGEPKPELKVMSLQVAFAGHEGPPWSCA